MSDSKVVTNLEKEGKAPKKQRVWEIDFLRGFSIFMMFLDHFAYDMKGIRYYFANFHEVGNSFIEGLSDFCLEYFIGGVRTPLHIFFVGLFFALSGISCSFSKNNFVHALKIFIGAAVISGATFALYYISGALGYQIDERIMLGVLVQLGLGVLLIALIQLIPLKWVRVPIYFVLAASLITCGFVFDIYSTKATAWLNRFPTWEDVPGMLWGSKGWGGDYFSSLWIGFSFLGALLGELFYPKKKSLLPKLDRGWHKPFSLLGKNTIWAYLIHQPVIIGLIVGVCLLLGYRF